jgi:hypothetical protein
MKRSNVVHTVGRKKKRHQLKNRRFLMYFFTGITYTVQCKKRPKPFPIEPVLRKNFYLTFTVTVVMYFLLV